MEKKKFPIGPEHYQLYEEVGQGVSASVHRALCVPFDEIVAIKILDFERHNGDLSNISREAQTMILVDHPNVLKSHCSFVIDHNLWVVMPFMAGGSCLHILKAAYPDGFEEAVIATILREVLKGLEYLHHHGHIHRDVKAGNILIDARGAIKLGDFGVSACLFDSGDRQRMRNTFVGTPCWMAPEVMEQLHGYDFKADIWSFGITALELAHGHAPFSKYPPMKVLLMTLQNAPPGLDYERDRKFSKSFKQMIASCLVKDPSKRPSAKKLLKHSFFKQARSNDYIARMLLEGLPALGDRIKALKRKEEDMLAQKKMPDGRKEEISQNEYKRGISGWNFNLEDVKAQASLIQDEDPVPDNNQVRTSNSLAGLEGHEKQPQMSSAGPFLQVAEQDNDLIPTQSTSLTFTRSSVNAMRSKMVRSDDNFSSASPCSEQHVLQNPSHNHDDNLKNNIHEKPILDNNGEISEGVASHTHERRGSSSESMTVTESTALLIRGESDKLQNLQQSNLACNGATANHAVDDTVLDIPTKVHKSSGASNSDELDEKAKPPVVQQRGRFKVTSENVEFEKVVPSAILQKSHSLQVLNQHAAVSVPSALEAAASTLSASSMFPLLLSVLQTNILQRESILRLMKQISTCETTAKLASDGGSSMENVGVTEKSLLEAAHDKEKELLNELADLQYRLICSQEEVQKYKTENAECEFDTGLGEAWRMQME
ncbi:serine/threonine-protein kinase OSR1-like isoform X6 [Tripterygium wilfordii]|uniref:serine/threonine-protein kinase OSR1-like isoform X6 n=1 Tax=Tripterygium wilfordii TaxID=458696 RepID=UPI0018F81B1F|nr:serine/threonine-protein kinase OSR1-like isoform X6 [Tripterygium wilfordii]